MGMSNALTEIPNGTEPAMVTLGGVAPQLVAFVHLPAIEGPHWDPTVAQVPAHFPPIQQQRLGFLAAASASAREILAMLRNPPEPTAAAALARLLATWLALMVDLSKMGPRLASERGWDT